MKRSIYQEADVRPMAQLNTSSFRKGSKVIVDGEPYDMLEVNSVKPGKGQAVYKCRMKNLLNGTILDRTYKSGDNLESAVIRKGEGQFLYKEPAELVFIDQKNSEQFTISSAVAGDQARFLQDKAVYDILYWSDRPVGVIASAQTIMKVTFTEPVERGNTSTNLTKPATVENGETVQVPAFVEIGEMIRINAQTGEYIERVR